MVALTRRQRAHVLIHNAALAAGGIGAGWISELWFLPDAIPLSILQGLLMAILCYLFVVRPLKCLLYGGAAAFLTAVCGRGLALLMFAAWPEEEQVVAPLVAVLMTELCGWLTYRGLLLLRGHAQHEDGWLAHAVEASERGPLRVLFCSVPMIAALLSVFIVFSVQRTATLRLRAPGIPAGPSRNIAYPLIERNEGLIYLSGTPQGQGERVRMAVRNDVLSDQLARAVIRPSPPRVRIMLWAPPQRELTVTTDWEVSLTVTSNYWDRVRARLYLLLLGLLGSLAMAWLGLHRAARARAAAAARAVMQDGG